MKCKIEIITPCHIGSGRKLINYLDFIADTDRIGIISPEKVYSIIGDEGIDGWCDSIGGKQSVLNIAKNHKPDVCLEDICERSLPLICERSLPLDGSVCSELSEQIKTNGVPYIPGSSLKGAIVSAIVGENSDAITLPERIQKKNNIVAEQVLVKPVEKKGKVTYPPFNSNLRFLRVGDAHFKRDTTVAIESYGLNLREQKSIIDKSAKMLIECIKEGQAVFEVQIARELHDKCGSTVLPLPEAMTSEENLLRAINRHTLRLLKEELEFWEEQKERDYYPKDEKQKKKIDPYLKQIGKLQRKAEDYEKSGRGALLRVGYGSGWRFMTGGWIDGEQQLKSVANITRNDKDGWRYGTYDFPKTRRIGFAPPFGFVKLTKED